MTDGLMFPKTMGMKKKKRQKHPKPIVATEPGICYLCAREGGNYTYQCTECHHVVFGGGGRKRSEGAGIKVYLCRRHHKEGKDAVHNCRATRERLCAYLQEAYEQDHTREEWMNIAYKNYL